jgi:serine/threonine-protein kinase
MGELGSPGGAAFTPRKVSGLPAGATTVAASSGSKFACAIAGGAAYCWGVNDEGQLGNGMTFVDSATPVAVSGGLVGLAEVSVSGGIDSGPFQENGTACVIRAGDLRCWGANDFGQYGDGTTKGRSSP